MRKVQVAANKPNLRLSWRSTPWKINMEPKDHPIEKGKNIFQTIIFRFHVYLPGCYQQNTPFQKWFGGGNSPFRCQGFFEINQF